MLLDVDLSVVFGCVEDTVNVKEDYRTKNSRSPSSFQLDGLVVTKHVLLVNNVHGGEVY